MKLSMSMNQQKKITLHNPELKYLKLEKFENQNFEARTVCLFKKPTQFPKDISIKLIKQIFLRKFFKVAQSDYNTNATDAVPTSIQ